MIKKREALFTWVMREKKDDIHKTLESDADIVENVVMQGDGKRYWKEVYYYH